MATCFPLNCSPFKIFEQPIRILSHTAPGKNPACNHLLQPYPLNPPPSDKPEKSTGISVKK
jgi:hypothetical protein